MPDMTDLRAGWLPFAVVVGTIAIYVLRYGVTGWPLGV